MASLASLTAYIQDSITTPMLEADPVYIELKSNGIASIITQVAKNYASSVTMLQPSDEKMVILYSQKEIYMRLATNFAPDWNVETQYTKLLKSDRFDHYIQLVGQISDEIAFQEKNVTVPFVEVGDATISARDGEIRNYHLAGAQAPLMVLSNITSSSVDIDWNQFDPSISRFSSYGISYGTAELYDPYEEQSILTQNIISSVLITDIYRVKYRLKDLLPSTEYHVLLTFRAMNGKKDYHTLSFTTLALA